MYKINKTMEGIDFNIIEDMPERQMNDWFKGTEDPVTRDDFSGATMQEMVDFIARMKA